jgi:hypothetical protein
MIFSWHIYNQHLINRGNFNLLIEDNILKSRSNNRGREYNKDLITSILMIRSIFNLQLRQTEGFFNGIKESIRLDVDIPDYSTISRGYKKVNIKQENYYNRTLLTYRDITTIVDSTGITVSRKGEWLSYKDECNTNKKNKSKNNNKDISVYKQSSKSKFIKLHKPVFILLNPLYCKPYISYLYNEVK